MKYLITGGCGFLGSNIASKLISNGNEVIIFDNLYRYGSEKNYKWLQTLGKFNFFHRDIRNTNDVENIIKKHRPDVIYHLAGQVAMTTSIEDPRMDFEVNVLGTFNILNSVRQYSPESIIIYSSTNKVYGDLEQYTYGEKEFRYTCNEKPNGFDELTQLDFHSPYGASKGSADQYILDFARIYNIQTVVFRHSSMYGGRQFATEDQGWVGWFCQKGIEIKKGRIDSITISGNGKQVRDLLHANDTVNLYISAVEYISSLRGKAFNIGGGIENSLSILELFKLLESILEIKIKYSSLPPRVSDQKVFVADIKKISEITSWKPMIPVKIGIEKMILWINSI